MTAAAPRMIAAEIYRRSTYGGWHPLRIARVSTVLDLSRALGWLPPEQYITSPRARPAALTAWHTPRYVAALQKAEDEGAVDEETRARHGLGTVSNPVFPEMFRRPATSAGASILAGELLRHPGVIHSPAGGTHHGFPDRAAGFCYLNDPVLAILSLRASGLRRIAYVDIDAHHADGVEHAFADDTDVLFISVHEERRWPFTGALSDRGAGEVWNLPVPRGVNDSEMALVRDDLILPRIAAFRPEAIVLHCGADAVEEDPLSRLALSNNAHWDVVAAIRGMTDRLLVLGGGGTFLSQARVMVDRGVPLLGVHFGKVGFLADFEIEDVKAHWDAIASGTCVQTQRVMLDVDVMPMDTPKWDGMDVEPEHSPGPGHHRTDSMPLTWCSADGAEYPFGSRKRSGGPPISNIRSLKRPL